MVKSSLKVEVTKLITNDNPYYGNIVSKNVVEHEELFSFDKRNNIAPSGIRALIKIGDNIHFDIEISRHHLDFESVNEYVTFFSVEEKTYEVYVKFDSNGKIDTIWLSEWLTQGFFEDGDDADNIYKNDDFITFNTIDL